MDKRFDDLRKSVVFNLSLAAKELFHSNFLGYLFENDNSLFCKIAELKNFDFDVKREHNNIDIEIIGKEKKYLIENKVKDIINDNQREKIEKKFKNRGYEKFYLFSLLGNNFEKEYPLWIEIGYEEIIRKLKTHNFSNPLIKSIKKDYCDFMSNMISLLKEKFLECDKYILFHKNETVNQFKEIRLHDLFLKYGMSHFIANFRKNNKDNEIKIDNSIQKSHSVMSFYKVKNGIKYGVQLEDSDYSRFIVAAEESKSYFEEIGWFDKKWESKNRKKYLSYGNKQNPKEKFWYQSGKRVIENISYDELTKFIKNDLDSIK
jgi:hypothetical protein